MALEGSAGGFVAAGFETVALEFERNFSERARLRAPIDKTLSMWPARCSLGIPATGADTSVSAHRVPRSGTMRWENAVGLIDRAMFAAEGATGFGRSPGNRSSSARSKNDARPSQVL